MAELQELLERVKAATGPDRKIDADIYNAIIDDGGRIAFKVKDWSRQPGSRLSRWHDGWLTGKGETDGYAEELERYTASLDAIVGLIERELPGWIIDHIGADALGQPAALKTIGWTAELWNGLCTVQGQSEALPLALCAAFLAAKIAQSDPSKANAAGVPR